MNEVWKRHQSELRQLIDSIEKKLKSYNDLLVSQSSLSEEFHQKFSEIRDWIEHQRDATSSLIEEIREIEREIDEIIKVVEIVSEEAGGLSTLIARVISSIGEGRGIVKYKEELLSKITETATEVDILARNAEIKSYQAGEEGRGFGVVAHEMAQLAVEVEPPVKQINEKAKEIIDGFGTIEKAVKRIEKFKEITHGLSTTLKKIGKEGIILLPLLRKSLSEVDRSLAELTDITGELEHSASEIGNWSIKAITTWEQNSILINQFLGLVRRINDLIHPVFRNKIVRILNRYPLRRLTFYRRAEIDTAHIGSLFDDIARLQKRQAEALGELRDKVNDWQGFLTELSQQFSSYHRDYEDLADLGLEMGDINRRILELKELVKELDFIFERARLLSLYARIEAVRPKIEVGLRSVSEQMRTLADEVTGISERLKAEIEKLFHFSQILAGDFMEVNSRIRRLLVDSQDAITFFNRVRERINRLAQDIATIESKLSAFELDKTISCGQRITETMDRIEGLRLEEEIASVIDQCQRIAHDAKEWPSVVTRRRALKIGMVGRPLLLDPGHRTDANSHRINVMIFNGLYQIDHRNNILPSIATSLDLSPDGKSWTFRLQRGVYFHDRREVKARDVLFTFQHILKGPNRSFIEMISGSKSYLAGERNIITGIDIVDDYTLTIRLDFPYLPFLATIACGVGDLIHEGFDPNHPVGAGPYRLVEWSGHIIRLEAFEGHFEGPPPIKVVEIHLLPSMRKGVELYQQDGLDIIPLSSDFASMVPEEEITISPLLSFRYLGINLRADSPLKDERLRQAISLAIDRERFVRECLGGWGVPAGGIFPPLLSPYDSRLSPRAIYDPDEARRLVAELGIKETFPLDVHDTEPSIIRGKWLADELSKVGIRIDVNPRSDLLEWTYRGKSLIAMKGWLSDNGDPDNFLFPLFHSSSWGNTGNTSFYSNPEVDSLIEQARTIRNQLRRDELYRTIERKILADLPVIPLVHNYSGYAVKPWVKGFVPDPFDVIKPANMWLA